MTTMPMLSHSNSLMDEDPGMMSEAETSATGFRRGSKQRATLPVVRTPSKTLERPLGETFRPLLSLSTTHYWATPKFVSFFLFWSQASPITWGVSSVAMNKVSPSSWMCAQERGSRADLERGRIRLRGAPPCASRESRPKAYLVNS